MGGGDLNLKKSWHPGLMKNQKRVWEEEKKALDERKKIQQLQKERQEERNIQELQRMQEAAGGNTRRDRVDWMYEGPANSSSENGPGMTADREAFLLGSRRLEKLVKPDEQTAKLQKDAAQDSFLTPQSGNIERDMANKIRDDPLFLMKKKEQEAREAALSDPTKRRALLQASGISDEPKREHKHRHRHHHRHHSHRDDRDDHDRRHRHRHRTEREDGRSRRHSFHSRERSYSHSRSRSPIRRSTDSHHARNGHREHRHNSYSPERRSHDDRRRHRSPRRSRHDSYGSPQQGHYRSRDHDRRDSLPYARYDRRDGPPQKRRDAAEDKTKDEEERARRLAEMQADAADLSRDRRSRVAAADAENDAERAHEDCKRGEGEYVANIRRQAGELSLAQTLGR